MRLGPFAARTVRSARDAWTAACRALGAGLASLVRAITYRRRELLVVALLATSVVGGFVVETWHRRAPAVFERLEAEPRRPVPARESPPPRATPPRRMPGPPPRGQPPPAARASPTPPATPERPLDLNRATAAELMRLPGIGPRLATRILARRDALGGRFRSAEDLATVPGLGERKVAPLRPLVTVGAEAAGPAARADPGTP